MYSSLKLIITCGFYKKFNSIAINSIHLKNQLCFYFLPLLQTSQKNIIVLFLTSIKVSILNNLNSNFRLSSKEYLILIL